MDLATVQQLSAAELSAVLDRLGIEEGWAVGDQCRANGSDTESGLPEPKERLQAGFPNMLVGTIAERAFRDDHLPDLEPEFEVVDYVEAGENRDYAVRRDGLELPINVKTASTLFRKAKTVVGLDPEDCVPISAYKAIGASERVPDLVYVDLVDFTLREKVDAFMANLEGDFGIGYHLFSWYGGKGTKKAQDRFATALFNEHGDALKALAPDATNFRVISAQRVLAILRENPRRVPGLGVRAAGTGGFNAEVNVHVSVENEMVPWEDIADTLRANGIQPALDSIRTTGTFTLPDPSI